MRVKRLTSVRDIENNRSQIYTITVTVHYNIPELNLGAEHIK